MEVTVFVVFKLTSDRQIDATANIEWLSRKHPHWRIVPLGRHGMALGRYDQTPVTIDVSTHASVAEETVDMAQDVVARQRVDPDVLRRIQEGTARFEIVWNTRFDKDLVPETADLVLDVAEDLATSVDGVALVQGAFLLPRERGADFEAYGFLFPPRRT